VPHLAHRPNEADCYVIAQVEMNRMFIVQAKIYTYSEDFFLTAFFTLRARGISTTVLVVGGGVTSAGGAVPATQW
jgi:hypothetical protein